jgi:hypothetical protein
MSAAAIVHPMDWDANFLGSQSSSAYSAPLSSSLTLAVKPRVSTLIPNCVGNWSGNYITNAQGGSGNFSVNFTTQKNGSVSGTFNSSVIGGTVVSTANIGTDKTMRGHISTNNNDFSFTASVSTNGKYITGRWSMHLSSGSWKTGIFTITRP